MVKVLRNITNDAGQVTQTQEQEMADEEYQQYLQDQAAAPGAAAAPGPGAGTPPSSDPMTTAAPIDQGTTAPFTPPTPPSATPPLQRTTAGLTATEAAPQAATTEGLTSSSTDTAGKKKATKAKAE